MNEILNKVFEVQSNLELTQELINVIIDMVEENDVSTPNGAMFFASQHDRLGALLHIAFDYVLNAEASLGKLQSKEGCVA